MRAALLAVLAWTACGASIVRAQAPDAGIGETLSSGSPAEQKKALETVLARPAAVASVELFLASAVAYQLGRIEDAGFLLYAAQLRARLDLGRFPPKDQGGDSPEVLIGTLSMQIGQAVNPALMRSPDAFEQVVARLRAWDAAGPAGYDPGWEHGPAKSPAQVSALLAELKRETLEPAENMVRLLRTPEYFEAFKTLQDFNLDASGQPPAPEKLAAARRAEQTMAAIEKRLNIPGLYSTPGAPASMLNDGPASAANPATGPAPAASPAAARRVGGAIAEPKRVRFVQPVMPPDLPPDVPRTVILELTVDEQGKVRDASVLRGHPAVDQAVARAVSQWVYEPALEYGRPVPVLFTVTVNLR
jgi:TonB family protein